MLLDINIIATDNLDLVKLKDENTMIESYLFEEVDGQASIEAYTLERIQVFNTLLRYIFSDFNEFKLLVNEKQVTIIDLTPAKNKIVGSEKLESFYPAWINETKRGNNMDEYGMFIGIIGYIQRHQNKNYLIAAIYPRK